MQNCFKNHLKITLKCENLLGQFFLSQKLGKTFHCARWELTHKLNFLGHEKELQWLAGQHIKTPSKAPLFLGAFDALHEEFFSYFSWLESIMKPYQCNVTSRFGSDKSLFSILNFNELSAKKCAKKKYFDQNMKQ